MLCTLQATVVEGGPRHRTIVQLGFFQHFSPCFRRIASCYLKLPGMIYSAVWQIVKDSINTASGLLLFTTR